MNKEYKFKLVLLGDFFVGKTSLIRKFVFNLFEEKYLTTVGVSITKKQMTISFNEKISEITLIIWDINGDNGYSKITPQYLMGASGAIIVADITRKETIDNFRNHINSFLAKNPQGKIVLALNKSDLMDVEKAKDVVKYTESLYSQEGCQVFITSAKEGTDVERMFSHITQKIMENG